MRVSENFELCEFVSQNTFEKWGENAIWFVNKKLIHLAQFAKDFFTDYFKRKKAFNGKYAGKKVAKVLIVINNWNNGGSYAYRGYREPQAYLTGQFKSNPAFESIHRLGLAFDCDVVVVFEDGTRYEPSTQELIAIILENWDLWKEAGLTTVEHWDAAPTWLHMDMRNTNIDELLIVKP